MRETSRKICADIHHMRGVRKPRRGDDKSAWLEMLLTKVSKPVYIVPIR